MNRRAYLALVGSVLGAGCLGAADGAPGGTDTQTATATPAEIESRTDGSDATATPTETRDPSPKVTVTVTLENRDGTARTGRLTVTHVLTPSCRYAATPCGMPTRQRVPLETAFELSPGARRTIGPVRMGIEGADDDTVDSYLVEVRTGGTEATLVGLEAGAASTVGRDEAGEYPWRVVSRPYDVRATLAADGTVSLAVQDVDRDA